MYDFNHLFNDFLADTAPEKVSPEIVRAFIRGKESLLRDESEAWLRSNHAKFASMAAQLRSEAARQDEDASSHLQLAARFDELASHRLPDPDGEDGLAYRD